MQMLHKAASYYSFPTIICPAFAVHMHGTCWRYEGHVVFQDPNSEMPIGRFFLPHAVY
jgi:hypothetical protein